MKRRDQSLEGEEIIVVDFEGENEEEAEIRLSCFARMNRLTKVAWRECRR